MKCLYLTARHMDHMALMLWHGLQSVLGEENVVDALHVPLLHRSMAGEHYCGIAPKYEFTSDLVVWDIGAKREGRVFKAGEHEDGFDLLVVNACVLNDHGKDTVEWCAKMLKPGGKVAWVDDDDSPTLHKLTCLPVDASFRKEIDTAVAYGIQPHHLSFAAPEHWFAKEERPESERLIDVFFSGRTQVDGSDRRGMMSKVFQTSKHHNVLVGSAGLGIGDYFQSLRRSKLALCPSSAGGADAFRTYEAVACGAIPVFIGYPQRIREPWFPEGTVIHCGVDDLPGVLDSTLQNDLGPVRQQLREWCLKHHTTRARALTVLKGVGLDA